MPSKTGRRRTPGPVIVISMGDLNGIGPEIALKASLEPAIRRICRPVLVGSTDVFAFYARRAGLNLTLRETEEADSPVPRGTIPVIPVSVFRTPVLSPGIPAVSAGSFAAEAIRRSVELCMEGTADALVTAPTSKDIMNRAGFRYPGQTEMVAALSGTLKPTMMLIAGSFRVALATVHLPLAKVASSLSRELIVRKLKAVHESLRSDFGISKPSIAVLGLNPHAGEHGLLGREEIRFIAPALRIARARKIDAEGPFPADGFFANGSHTRYDAVLAMYHDQGLIPLKMSGFDIGVNFSSGLNLIRTSPDHGTAYELAGTGRANPRSMIEAISLAVTIARNRNHDRV